MSDNDFHTSFSKQTWEAFKTDQRPGPLQMLNLIRLRDHADYADGRASTGAEAYTRYSDISAPIFEQSGGKILWRGGHELTMIGPQSEVWHIAFVAEYPSVGAFLDMMKDPIYRQAMVHRQAGVLDSRLLRFCADAAGTSFAGQARLGNQLRPRTRAELVTPSAHSPQRNNDSSEISWSD